jgi:hypothetical protein
VQSDIVNVPACRPNPPFNLCVATVNDDEDGMTRAISSISLTGHEDDDGYDSDKGKEQELVKDREVKRKQIPDIGHDFIVLRWTNGKSNGSPVLEFEIEMAYIRAYRDVDMPEDDQPSAGAFQEVNSVKGGKKPSRSTKTRPAVKPSNPSKLEWVNISKKGDVLGPNAFRATGLAPGSSYCFRVR